jgi:hypothetical protein
MTDKCEDKATSLEANLQLSCTARAIAHCGDVGSCVARGVAMLFLLMAGTFSVVTPEPLWVRAMSFSVLGLVPATAAYLIACLFSWTLRSAGRMYDPVAAVLWPALWAITKHMLSALLDFAWVALIYFLSALETCANLLGVICVRIITISARVLHRLLRIGFIHTAGIIRVWGCNATAAVHRALGTCKGFASRASACLCSAAHHYSRVMWRRIVMSVTFPIRLVARLLLKLIPSAA